VSQAIGVRPPRQWLTIDQVAQLLEISRATAYRLIHERRLQHVRISNVVKVHVEQFRAYVRSAIQGQSA
jgi:excisionase family DNA binding protein